MNFENWISGASEVFKNQSFKKIYFDPLRKIATLYGNKGG